MIGSTLAAKVTQSSSSNYYNECRIYSLLTLSPIRQRTKDFHEATSWRKKHKSFFEDGWKKLTLMKESLEVGSFNLDFFVFKHIKTTMGPILLTWLIFNNYFPHSISSKSISFHLLAFLSIMFEHPILNVIINNFVSHFVKDITLLIFILHI